MCADSPRHPKISIIIVNWNAGQELLDCLESLKGYPPAESFEAIVVDNASVDGSVSAVREHAPDVRVIVNETNRGLAAANNQGILAALGDTLIISNPDVVFLPGTTDALITFLDAKPRAAFVFARLLNADGSVQPSVGDLPTLRQALLGRHRQRPVAGEPPFGGVWWDGWAHDQEVPIGHGGEACFAVRRAALEDIGLQDEKFPLDWEGIDWCARAWRAGWEVWFCPSAEVIHLGARSIRKARYRWVIRSHKGMYRYFASRTSPVVAPLLALAIAARAILKLVAVGMRRGYYEPTSPT